MTAPVTADWCRQKQVSKWNKLSKWINSHVANAEFQWPARSTYIHSILPKLISISPLECSTTRFGRDPCVGQSTFLACHLSFVLLSQFSFSFSFSFWATFCLSPCLALNACVSHNDDNDNEAIITSFNRVNKQVKLMLVCDYRLFACKSSRFLATLERKWDNATTSWAANWSQTPFKTFQTKQFIIISASDDQQTYSSKGYFFSPWKIPRARFKPFDEPWASNFWATL